MAMNLDLLLAPDGAPAQTSDSLLLKHTSFVCIVFGSLCSAVCEPLDKSMAAHLGTAEAHLFTRHFGLAMLIIAFFCDALRTSATPRVQAALLLWHGMVLMAFFYEFLVRRVWQSSPWITQASACAGVVLHAMIFFEGLVEVGVFANDIGRVAASNRPGPAADWLRSAALDCSLERRAIIGLIFAASFALIYDPVGRFLTRRCKSINDGPGASRVPSHYWPTVFGSLAQIAMWIAASTRFIPALGHVSFRAEELSLLNTLPAILLCMTIAELGFYLSHRAFHHRLLFRHVHAVHHRIEAPVSAYDALYQDPIEFEVNLIITYLPIFFVPIHVGAIACYLYLSGFIAFVLNHSGREFELAVPIPFTTPPEHYVVWSTRLHDDHHFFRQGNFGAQLWCFDEIFGTRIERVRPKTRTKRRWHTVGDVVQALAKLKEPLQSSTAAAAAGA